MNIGFWNIDSASKKSTKDLSDSLVSLTIEKSLDIICLAEINENITLEYLKKINKKSTNKYHQVKCSKNKLTLISRFADTVFEDLSSQYISPRWLVHKVTIPTKITFNLISVHFHSKLNWSEQSLSLECVNLSRDIAIIEDYTKCDETILIGDFNMSPFENGLVSANGLHAIQDLNYARKRPKGRDIDGEFYKFFYNPMWNFFGDFSEPLGTCYYRIPGHISHEWHMYDQVIIRPTLITFLNKPFIEIVTQIYSENLTKTFNRPDRNNYSDHLPVILKLKL